MEQNMLQSECIIYNQIKKSEGNNSFTLLVITPKLIIVLQTSALAFVRYSQTLNNTYPE
jgi:hypothetical protein